MTVLVSQNVRKCVGNNKGLSIDRCGAPELENTGAIYIQYTLTITHWLLATTNCILNK